MTTAYLYLFFGLLFLLVGIGTEWLKRFPLTTSVLYLGSGILMGPYLFDLIRLDPLSSSKLLEHLTEVAVIISLFSAGLKLKLSLKHKYWLLALNLAFTSMAFTVGIIAITSYMFLNLSAGASILLGAMLAPTDPVLASDVQVKHPGDHDQLRFSLTSEAGLNDGTAFPFVVLGLGFLEKRSSMAILPDWIIFDLLWPVLGGLGVGALIGYLISVFDNAVRKKAKHATILDDFLALSLISLSYGIALLMKTYGFLAVFAAAVAVRQLEVWRKRDLPMASGVLIMNEQFERLAEVGIVILLGALLRTEMANPTVLISAFFLLLVIRPLSVLVIAPFFRHNVKRLIYTSWFGIRGIGSVYYLMYSLQHGLAGPEAQTLTNITLMTITISIVLHGLSVTPLMKRYKSS